MGKIKGWRGVILIAYTWFILMAYAIIYVAYSGDGMGTGYIISLAEASLFISILVCQKLLNWAENLNIEAEVFTQREKVRYFFNTWLKVFGVFFVMYLFCYPGGITPDNIDQYIQAIGIKQYNDHHPVLQTLFTFKLPLILTNGWIGSINLFQIIIFSLSIAYMACVLREYGNKSYSKFFLLFIMLNPSTLCFSIIPLKDTSYAILALLLMTFAVKIHFTKGKWLADAKHSVIFIIVMTLATIFRHNAILFTLPLFLAVFLYIKKRQAAIMLLCFLGLFYFVKGPFYNFLNVERPTDNRQIETLGLPMTIIGNAVTKAPEKLDSEVLEFAYDFASQDLWKEYFKTYVGFDSIKNAGEIQYLIHLQAIEKAGWRKVLNLTLKCFKEAPFESLRGMLAVTNFVHGIFGAGLGLTKSLIAENNLGLTSNKFFSLKFLSGRISEHFAGYRSAITNGEGITLQAWLIIALSVINLLFKYIFQYIGVINFVVLIFILAKLNFNRKYDWKRLCLVLPIFTYNFGTMLLLSSPLFRVFYYSYLVFPLVLLVLLRDEAN